MLITLAMAIAAADEANRTRRNLARIELGGRAETWQTMESHSGIGPGTLAYHMNVAAYAAADARRMATRTAAY